MTLVVDASVAVKWFVREALHEEAKQLLEYREELYSPDFIVAEITNVAWKKASRGEIGQSHAREIAAAIRRGVPSLYPTALFNERALELALQLRHPAYDCLYLACAEEHDAILITADAEFHKKAAGAGFRDRVEALGARPISAMIGR